MMKSQFFFSVLFMIASYLSCQAQKKISLEDAIEILYENSLTLKQSALREQVSRNNANIAQGGLYPNLYLTANNQHTMGMVFDQISGKLITGNQWSNYATGSIGTSIILYQGGLKQNTLKAENLNIELALLDSEKLKRELKLQLLSLFTQALINHDLWNAGKSQLLLSERQLQEEEVFMQVGKRTLIDVSQAKAKVANDRLNVVSTKNAYILSLMKLKQLLEMEESEELEVLPPKVYPNDMVSFDGYLLNDPYIRILNKQMELAELNIKLARTSYFPTISLNSSYGTNYSSQRQNLLTSKVIPFWDQFNQNKMLYGNIALTIPIFDGFRTKLNVKTAKLNKESLGYGIKQLERERKQIFSQARLEFQSAKEELNALTAAYDAYKVNFEAIDERYKIGKSSSIDVYKAITEYNIIEFRVIAARYNVFYSYKILEFFRE